MGFFKKIFKAAKKVVKPITKIVKKVAKKVAKIGKSVMKGVAKISNKLGHQCCGTLLCIWSGEF